LPLSTSNEMAKDNDEPLADDQKQVSHTLGFQINTATKEAIIQSIRRVDDISLEVLPNDAPLAAVRDYATKPAYRTTADGRRVKARGPLADSLEDYIRTFVRVGKVRWESVIDDRTAEVDAALNGTIWDADDPAAPIPPLHPNCRCRRVPIPDEEGIYS